MRFAAMAQPAKPRPQLLSLRPAVPEDAGDIVELTNLAGDGLPLALWRQMAQAGQDPMLLGRQRAQRTTGGYSYTRAEMALVDDIVAGGIIDYALGDEPDPITAETPPLVVPLNELENLVCGSWYVNILAVKPLWRRLGIGRQLLVAADRRARVHGRSEVSIIVSDAKAPAQALYAAHGFREKARRPMSKHGWDGPGENWLLLVKRL
jgi:ribosomal protein S18 acetylase RimI-like enzyme